MIYCNKSSFDLADMQHFHCVCDFVTSLVGPFLLYKIVLKMVIYSQVFITKVARRTNNNNYCQEQLYRPYRSYFGNCRTNFAHFCVPERAKLVGTNYKRPRIHKYQSFSDVRVRVRGLLWSPRTRTLKTLRTRTRTQRVCLFTHLYSKKSTFYKKIRNFIFFFF
jgi:hypothetical protein